MTNPASPHPLRLAVVGSGPAALFTVDAVRRHRATAHVEIFERLPAPFGLVRYGVAPDHPHTRRVTKLLEATLRRPGVTLHLNQPIVSAADVAALRERFDAVLLATGAATDRALGIPGEGLEGVWPSLAFAGWVNGHPDFAGRTLPAADTAVIIGHGNVALDAARLLARGGDLPAETDMAPAARAALAQHTIRRIVIVGRRGPAQVAFGPSELEELAALPGWEVRPEAGALSLDARDAAELAAGPERAREALDVLQRMAAAPAAREKSRTIEILFHRSPHSFAGTGRLRGVRFARCRLDGAPGQRHVVTTDEVEDLRAGLAIRAIGHVGQPLPGVPFDSAAGVIPCIGAWVQDGAGPARGLYAAGWIRRGAKGLIGHNQRDAHEAAAAILADFPAR